MTAVRGLRVAGECRGRRVLAVFAHPDDETVACGGTLHRLATHGAAVTLLILTAGERGNPDGVPDAALKVVRSAEADAAAMQLGVRQVVHADCGDGVLWEHAGSAAALVATWLQRTHADLVITHDPAGVDGHADHIACAEVVTNACRRHGSGVALWYATIPRALATALRAIGQLRTDSRAEQRRRGATHRVCIGRDLPAKVAAIRAHRSQHGAIGKGLGRIVPAPLALALMPFEWFAEVQPVD